MNSSRLVAIAGFVVLFFGFAVSSNAQGSWALGSYQIDPGSVTIVLDPPDDIEAASAGAGVYGTSASAARTGASAEITAIISRDFTWTTFNNTPVPTTIVITISGSLSGSTTGPPGTSTAESKILPDAIVYDDSAPADYFYSITPAVFTVSTGGASTIRYHVGTYALATGFAHAGARVTIAH